MLAFSCSCSNAGWPVCYAPRAIEKQNRHRMTVYFESEEKTLVLLREPDSRASLRRAASASKETYLKLPDYSPCQGVFKFY